ncbi:MAG: ABC transporter substrate-binding protein [Propionibacteriales bacterium]|nr:ABC transporter substrate-binding protein [Propionibacteriales bacterium]
MRRALRCDARVLIALAGTLLVAACSGGATGDGGAQADSDGPSGGTFSINLTEPSFLAPASQCYESECYKVLNLVNDPLVNVDTETGELVFNGLAESIEPDEDQGVWTVVLREGRTFQNGEPINAEALITTWSYTADPANEANTAGFMSHIEGAGEGESISGLRMVDDLTVEVTLTGPFSQFGAQMSYGPAFTPMAPECMADAEACNEAPIGSGPYMIDGQWNHDQAITVTKWSDYQGDLTGQADTVEFTMFADMVAAFRAFQGGTLDVLDAVEPTIYGEAVQAAGDRITTTETGNLTYMGFPTQTAPFDSVEYRQAVSQAFDRQAIIDSLLNGQAKASTDIVTPPIPGSRDDACNYCEIDVETAAQSFAAAGGAEGDTIELWFNAGSGHESWVEAIGNELKNNLGINFTMKGVEWAQYLETLDTGNFTGPFRAGWGMDYPSPENYLRPIVGTGGDTNYSQYSNKEVDDLLVQGDQAATTEEAYAFYQQAGDIALEEMPILPLWSGINNTIWSENVDNVVYDGLRAEVNLLDVTVN